MFPVTPNKCGMYTHDVCELLEYKGSKIEITIKICNPETDVWLYGVDVWANFILSGYGFSPSINSPKYKTREEAIDAAIQDITKWLISSYKKSKESAIQYANEIKKFYLGKVYQQTSWI